VSQIIKITIYIKIPNSVSKMVIFVWLVNGNHQVADKDGASI